MRRLQATAGANLLVLVFVKELARLDVLAVLVLVLEVVLVLVLAAVAQDAQTDVKTLANQLAQELVLAAVRVVLELALMLARDVEIIARHLAQAIVLAIATGRVLAVAILDVVQLVAAGVKVRARVRAKAGFLAAYRNERDWL